MNITTKQREVKCKETVGVLHNKKAWIKIIEAFVALILVAVVIIIIVSQGYLSLKDTSQDFFSKEVVILREVQLDDGFRTSILSSDIPVEWDDAGFPPDVKTRITERTPTGLNCSAKLCALDGLCGLTTSPDTAVYAKSVVISSDITTYSPRQLKMFCWEI
ncbi:hypothetical protein ACFLZJ_01605 [Nanoarchaeota archaeon]